MENRSSESRKAQMSGADSRVRVLTRPSEFGGEGGSLVFPCCEAWCVSKGIHALGLYAPVLGESVNELL